MTQADRDYTLPPLMREEEFDGTLGEGRPATLTLEQEAEVERQLAIAESEERAAEVRVNFRMAPTSLAFVRRAAALYGVPYQTYLKQAAVRQAIADLKDAAAAR